MWTDTFDLTVLLVSLCAAAAVVIAIFRRDRYLRMTAVVILVIGIILREDFFSSYLRSLISPGHFTAAQSEIYQAGIRTLMKYSGDTSIYVYAVALMLAVLGIQCHRQYGPKNRE
jgi:ABC-type enterochelin transport system permease subunit